MKRINRGLGAMVVAIVAAAACASDTTQPLAATDGGTSGTSGSDTVIVTLGQTTLTVGQSVQAQAIVRDAAGSAVSGVTITWNSSAPGVATVSSTGAIVAVGPGSTHVSASAAGKTATADVTVNASVSANTGPAPEPAAGDVILAQDDFERAAAEIKSGYATRGAIASTDGHNGGTAIRFQYSAGSDDNLIEDSFTPTKDIYVRYWFRTSRGADPTCNDKNPSGMKWFMLWRDAGERYTMGAGNLGTGNAGLEFTSHDNGSTNMPNPFLQNKTKSLRLGTTNDGAWHKYTAHVVTGSGGYEQIWIDGTLVLDDSGNGYNHDAGGIALIQLPGAVVSFTGCSNFTIDADDLAIWHK